MMNTLILVLEGVLLVSCFLQRVESFTPWIKPKGDISGSNSRNIKVKIRQPQIIFHSNSNSNKHKSILMALV